MFEFEPGLIIWTSVSFALLVFLLYRSALPLLLDFLRQREKSIADSLAEALGNRQKSEEILTEQKKLLEEARRQAERIVELAAKEGDKLKSEIIGRAQKQASVIVAQARQDIIREKQKVVSEAQKDVAEMVTSAAGKLLRRVISLDDHRRLVEESLAEAQHERN